MFNGLKYNMGSDRKITYAVRMLKHSLLNVWELKGSTSIWCQFLTAQHVGVLMSVVLWVLRGIRETEKFPLNASPYYFQHALLIIISPQKSDNSKSFQYILGIYEFKMIFKYTMLVEFCFNPQQIGMFPFKRALCILLS